MNEFDQFVKHKLKAKYYLRYADDFLLLSEGRARLEKPIDHRVLRTTTKRRMMRKLQQSPRLATFNSYLGLLCHGNTYKLQKEVAKNYLLSQ